MVNKKDYYIGNRYTTNEGYEIEIIEYFNYKNCTIKFIHNGLEIRNRALTNVLKGNISNPYHRSYLSVGFLGQGKHKTKIDNRSSLVYIVWSGVITRCYSERWVRKHPAYKGCLVCEEWHNFQNFGDWYEESYNPEIMEGWQLDKDILIKGNKIYSPETCCFVPQEINKLFTKSDNSRGNLPIGVRSTKNNKFQSRFCKNNENTYLGQYDTPEEAFQAYKTAKEQHIKEVADKWKDKITEKVYQAMYNYEVEIAD